MILTPDWNVTSVTVCRLFDFIWLFLNSYLCNILNSQCMIRKNTLSESIIILIYRYPTWFGEVFCLFYTFIFFNFDLLTSIYLLSFKFAYHSC